VPKTLKCSGDIYVFSFVHSIKCQNRPLVGRQCSVQLNGTNYRYKYSLLMTTLYQNPWLLGPKYSPCSHPKLAVFVLTLTYIMYSVHTYPDKRKGFGKFRPTYIHMERVPHRTKSGCWIFLTPLVLWSTLNPQTSELLVIS
jgi:hypothetical protein